MYKRHNIGIILLFIILFGVSYFMRFEYDKDFIANIITFLSILVGFSMTSLSLLFTSNVMKDFYNNIDAEDSSLTKLHRLKNYYKISVLIEISSIAFFLIISLIGLTSILQHAILGILGIDIYLFILLFLFFLDLFVFENSKK